MTDIVLELQNAASDSSVKVSDLLRKALGVARKLKVIDYEPWVTHELYGYLDINGDYKLIPQYRYLKSKIDYKIISSSSIDYLDPLSFGINPSDPHKNTRDFPCHLSIPEIERILEGETKNNFVHIPVQPDIEKLYKEDLKYVHPSEPIVLTVQAFLLTEILEVVRTEIFEWCLELEENGISGEEPLPFKVLDYHTDGVTVEWKNKPKRINSKVFGAELAELCQTCVPRVKVRRGISRDNLKNDEFLNKFFKAQTDMGADYLARRD